jgi:hypothetical protein
MNGQLQAPAPIPPGERAPDRQWISWVGPRAGLDHVEKIIDPTRIRTLTVGRPTRSQSLYRLHYPGSLFILILASHLCLVSQVVSDFLPM